MKANFSASGTAALLILTLVGCSSDPSQEELQEVHSSVAETFRFHDGMDLLEGTYDGADRAWAEVKSYCRLYYQKGEVLNKSGEDIAASISKERFWRNFGIDASEPASLWSTCMYEGANQFRIRTGDNPSDLWEH